MSTAYKFIFPFFFFYNSLVLHTNNSFSLKAISISNNSSTIDSSKIIGKWTCSMPYYSSELEITPNGKFSFHEQGCLGQGYSEGDWKIEGLNLVITSLPKYKPDLRTMNVTQYDTSKKAFDSIKPVVVSNIGIKRIHSNTLNVFFDRQVFNLLNDTLYQLDSKNLKTDTKYLKLKNGG